MVKAFPDVPALQGGGAREEHLAELLIWIVAMSLGTMSKDV